MEQIFKLQRPMFPPSSTLVLAYTEDSSIMCEVHLKEDEVHALFCDELKVFVSAIYDRDARKLTISDLAPWQNW